MRVLIRVLILAAVVLTGCSSRPKLVPVSGKVVQQGKQITAGSIWFHAADGNAWQGEKPSCQLSLEGAFTMRTYPHGNGVPPGAYKVTLSPELAKRINAPAYSDPNKTPWSIEVPDAGVSDKVFEVNFF